MEILLWWTFPSWPLSIKCLLRPNFQFSIIFFKAVCGSFKVANFINKIIHRANACCLVINWKGFDALKKSFSSIFKGISQFFLIQGKNHTVINPFLQFQGITSQGLNSFCFLYDDKMRPFVRLVANSIIYRCLGAFFKTIFIKQVEGFIMIIAW